MDSWLEKKFSRKDFLKVAGTGLTLMALEGMLKKVSAEEVEPDGSGNRRYAMVIDLGRCVGCEACTVACKVENNIPNDYSGKPGRDLAFNQVIVMEDDHYPKTDKEILPRPCFHCDNPSCTKVCPVGATFKDEERGLVLVSYDDCIGCRYCAVACPYNVRSFNWSKPYWPKEREGTLNPDLEANVERGVMSKCTFCVHKIKAAEQAAKEDDRAVLDGEIKTSCCNTCMGRARFFGDLNDPNSKVSELARSGRAYRIDEHLGTEPKVFYLKEK